MGCVVVLTVVLKRYYLLQLDIVTNGYILQLSSLILVNFKFTSNLIETDALIQSANVDSSFSDNSSVILDGIGKVYDASIQSMFNTYEPQGDRSKENYRERNYTQSDVGGLTEVTKYLVPALLPMAPAEVSDGKWSDRPFNSCLFFFATSDIPDDLFAL